MDLMFPEEFAVGVPELDDCHRMLYAQVNALHDAMRTKGRPQVTALIGYLEGYVREHFAVEERLMRATGYADLPIHRSRHLEFSADFQCWKDRLAKSGPTAAFVVEFSSWISGWLGEHVRKVDGPMARHLRASLRNAEPGWRG